MSQDTDSLFQTITPRPLADNMRPKNLHDVIGQDHLTAAEAPLGRMLEEGRLYSIIFWGPPGTGKTTLARLLSENPKYDFEALSAVFAGVADLRRVFDTARQRRSDGKGTLLFVDEIHRFNRSQQDSFLPLVEDGTVVLVGATTENPSFELNAALLSRCKVLVLKRLERPALRELILRAEKKLGRNLPLSADARTALCDMADGDGRYLLNLVEEVSSVATETPLDVSALTEFTNKRVPIYDKSRETHHNLISALHKSLRGSDVDAALYWVSRMLVGGEDPRYIARRLTRFAVEDIGLADPRALEQCIAAWQAFERIGSPEGEIAIAQCTIYLATAPKSNASYQSHLAATCSAKRTGSLPPPKHILNAPTEMMKDLGYGAGYQYDHDTDEAFSGQTYFPDDILPENFYKPTDRGFEKEIQKRLEFWNSRRRDNRMKKEKI